MGIGRRDFLSAMGLAIGHRLLDGPVARIIAEDRFICTDLGISFEKPRGWVFITPDDLRTTATKIGDKAGVGEMNPSLMNISKEAWSVPPRFTPGVNVWSYPKEYSTSLVAFAHDSICSHSFYRDFRVISDGKPIEVSSCPATVATASFLFDHTGMPEPVPVRDRFLCIEQEMRFYLITMCDAPELQMAEGRSFDRFQESILIA